MDGTGTTGGRGGALVQSAETYAGTQALELVQGEQPAGCWHHFGGCGHSSVWVRMWLRPVVSALPDTSGITDAVAAVVGFSPEGRWAALEVFFGRETVVKGAVRKNTLQSDGFWGCHDK